MRRLPSLKCITPSVIKVKQKTTHPPRGSPPVSPAGSVQNGSAIINGIHYRFAASLPSQGKALLFPLRYPREKAKVRGEG